MTINFSDIEYLKSGNKRQQKAYYHLSELKIFERLSVYTPILTGTIPIDIDLPNSDLDIICQCKDHLEFLETLKELFSKEHNFTVHTSSWNSLPTTIAKFRTGEFDIEIFGQNLATHKQNAYKHMIIEHKILTKMGSEFKATILNLKRSGLKTEPAFAKLLELEGDPYEALLKLEDFP